MVSLSWINDGEGNFTRRASMVLPAAGSLTQYQQLIMTLMEISISMFVAIIRDPESIGITSLQGQFLTTMQITEAGMHSFATMAIGHFVM